MGTKKGIVLLYLAALIVAVGAGPPRAGEPLLLVYPQQPVVFRYDHGRYELVTAGDPKFNLVYSVSSTMLWDRIDERIPCEIYRAPQLTGFAPSPYAMNEYVLTQSSADVVVDGFSDFARTYANLYMRFIPVPSTSFVEISIDGQPVDGLVVRLSDLQVVTDLGDGHFSDTMLKHLVWSGAAGLRIVVYSDKDNDGLYSGGKPLYSILLEENTVSTQPASWGAVKALYGQ